MRKRKLLTIAAVAAACLCICWGATAFANPPSTGTVQPPDAGKTIEQAPRASLGATVTRTSPALALSEPIAGFIPPTVGGTPRDGGEPRGTMVYDDRSTVQSAYAPADLTWYFGEDVTLAAGPRWLDSIYFAVWNFTGQAQLESVTVTFYFFTEYTRATQLGTVTVNLTAMALPGGYYSTYAVEGLYATGTRILLTETPMWVMKFSSPTPAVARIGSVLANPIILGSSTDDFWRAQSLAPGTAGWAWFSGNPLANFYFGMDAVSGGLTGSCCIGTTCTVTTQANCTGTWTDGGVCTPNPCKGACCNPVNGTCTEVADAAACTALSGIFRGAGTVCPPTPACYTRPLCPTTPNPTLYGQQPYLPDESWVFVTSELAQGDLRADKFENTPGTIKDIHWWGLTLSNNPWAACDTEVPMTFNITFYADDGFGLPLPTPLKTYTAVTPTITSTGLSFSGFDMKYFSLTLPTGDPWYQVSGWVAIQGTSIGTPNCWFLWAGSPFGGATSATRTGTGAWTQATDVFDLAFCITGTSTVVLGACCQDETTCVPNTPQLNCLPPWRWEANKTCAQMLPLCGRGACCSGPVGTKICTANLTEAQCTALTNGVFQGLGSACTPDPCNSACCLPNHTCVLTDIDNCATLGGVFMPDKKSCTPDPCPPHGDTCADPIVIPGPGTYTGNTCAFTHDYNEACTYTPTGAPDLVYAYTPTADICVDLTLCTGTTNYDTKLYVYDNTCVSPFFACNDDSCANGTTYPNPYISKLTYQYLLAGHTYYIVVDGYSAADCGDFTLAITACLPPCDVICTVPPGVAEGEPICADEYVDVTNTGCNSTIPVFSTVLTCNGPTVCATSGTFLVAGASNRDTDWYQVVTTTQQIMTLTVEAEFDVAFGLIEQTVPGVPGCANITGYINPYLSKGPCEPDSVVTACLPAGTYYFFVAPSVFTGVTCGKEYKATLTCAPCTVQPGACCNPVDGTCTLVADAAACPTGSIFHGAGTVCDPNPCFVRPTCPTNTLWGQQPYLPDESWNFGTSDTGPSPANNRAEYYSGVAANICDIHWWGMQMYNNGTAWVNCAENPMNFDITFYADAGGFPGAVVNSYLNVPITGTATTLMYATYGPMMYYSYTLPTCVNQAAGWVSIQGVSAPTTCWFLWAGSPQGNAASALWTGPSGPWAADTLDLAVCLTGTVAPPTGACCQLSGFCEVKTQAECVAPAIWQGAGTTCVPNLCPTYCATCRGDVSGNNVLNGADVQAFVNCVILGGPVAQACACADMDQNGFVNLLDVNAFVTKLITAAVPCPPP